MLSTPINVDWVKAFEVINNIDIIVNNLIVFLL